MPRPDPNQAKIRGGPRPRWMPAIRWIVGAGWREKDTRYPFHLNAVATDEDMLARGEVVYDRPYAEDGAGFRPVLVA